MVLNFNTFEICVKDIFITLFHLSKERQKYHDIDSEEFQLYKHATEEEYKMQVFCDNNLIFFILIV